MEFQITVKVSFIRYGSMARALASKWAGKHAVLFSGRDTDRARAVAESFQDAGHGSGADAVAFGVGGVLATRHEHMFDGIEKAGGTEAFAGKTFLDINNPYEEQTSLNKTCDGRSLSEAIAAAVPGASVVKAFNMCQARVWMLKPLQFDGRPLVTLFCGDDMKAKTRVAELIEDVGSEPLDLGDLRFARLLEPAAAIVITLLRRGADPRTVLNLIRH